MTEIAKMTREELIAHAEDAGIDIDRRWSRDRLFSVISDAVAPQILTRQVVASDMAKLEGMSDLPQQFVAALDADSFGGKVAAPGSFNLDSAVSIWAEGFASGLDRAWAEFDGPVFRVVVRTKHGQTMAELLDVADTEAGVMAALEIAKAKMSGGE